jgi:hypothetical protein
MILVKPETFAPARGWPADVHTNNAGQTNAETASPDDGSFRPTRGQRGVRAEAAMTLAAASHGIGRQSRCTARAVLMLRQAPCT